MKLGHILFLLILLGIFYIAIPCFGATVGNPLDLDVPAKSAVLRQEAVDNALDEYEEVVKIKTSLDLEFVFDKDLRTSSEVTKAEMESSWYMVKFGTTFFNRIEPYIKIGTSKFDVSWTQNNTTDVNVESSEGFAWGGGLKGMIWEFDDLGIRLTGDIQYRTAKPDLSDISLGNSGITDLGADFEIEEWQASIALSKKFELPLRWQNIYIVPYTGFSVSDSTVKAKVTDSNNPGAYYGLFDASNDSIYGAFLGCDIMPSLTSSFIYSIEVRLINEIALTLGGAMKF